MDWVFKAALIFFLLNLVCTAFTDIGFIYEHGVILLQNSSGLASEISLKKGELLNQLPYEFEYPIALAYDPTQKLLFVSDANNKNTEIFSFSLNSEKSIVKSLISKQKQSIIDSVAYDPVKNQLIWTDSYKKGIYYADLNSENLTQNSVPSPVLVANNEIVQPRAITIDYCNRFVYWTERHSKNPAIKRYNMSDYSVETIKMARNGSYFQGINYNVLRKELIWAETKGDNEKNSSCNILSKSMETGVETILASFNHCYPFSLTSDLDYIYWSDWSRGGIMRLNRKDILNEGLVKLVSTPASKTKEGHHNGAFGIVNLEKHINLSDADCISTKDEDGLTLKGKNTTNNTSFEDGITSGSQGLLASFKDPYPYYNLRLVIILLAFGCSFFLSTTLVLLGRIAFSDSECLRGIKNRLNFEAGRKSKDCPKSKPVKKHRKFHFNRELLAGQLCARDNDGIKIDIEDCCQMTLCDTPCYTSLKKEGRGYKLSSNSANTEDKEKLLEF